MRRMEMLSLVVATGRADPDTKNVEYRITDASRAELEERDGLSAGLSDSECVTPTKIAARIASPELFWSCPHQSGHGAGCI